MAGRSRHRSVADAGKVVTEVGVGVDVGGTKITGAMVTADGETLGLVRVPTPTTDQGADPRAAATVAMVDRLMSWPNDEADLRVQGVGIGVPEYVTPDGAITSTEVLAWSDVEIRLKWAPLATTFDSDVRCGARAERDHGLGRDLAGFLFVSIGTGISHALVVDGMIWPGHRGEAIALGEFPVPAEQALRPDAPLTVEQQASGRALEDLGDDQAHPRGGRLVAEALATVVRLVDPQAIILGGGLGSSRGPYAQALHARYRELAESRPNPPPLFRSTLGNRGGVIGAGLAALHPTDSST